MSRRSIQRGRGYVRFIGLSFAEPSGGDLVQHMGESGALLLDGDGAVSVLISEVFYFRSQMAEENYTESLDRRPTGKYGQNNSQTFSSPIS